MGREIDIDREEIDDREKECVCRKEGRQRKRKIDRDREEIDDREKEIVCRKERRQRQRRDRSLPSVMLSPILSMPIGGLQPLWMFML